MTVNCKKAAKELVDHLFRKEVWMTKDEHKELVSEIEKTVFDTMKVSSKQELAMLIQRELELIEDNTKRTMALNALRTSWGIYD
jgi:hypothetical protein